MRIGAAGALLGDDDGEAGGGIYHDLDMLVGIASRWINEQGVLGSIGFRCGLTACASDWKARVFARYRCNRRLSAARQFSEQPPFCGAFTPESDVGILRTLERWSIASALNLPATLLRSKREQRDARTARARGTVSPPVA